MKRFGARAGVEALFLLAGFLFTATSVYAKEAEAVWQELGKLSGAERQRALLAGAKSEGAVVIYSNISEDNMQVLRADFEKRYAIKFDSYRASGERISNRVLTEARGGRFIPDVIGPSNEHLPALI